jgi:serine/threonine protein kinase
MGCEASRTLSASEYVEVDRCGLDASCSVYDDPRWCRGTLRADYIVNDNILGNGANGHVTTCSSRKTGQTYALKVLRKGKKLNPKDEVFAYLQLEHPHIASLFGVYEKDDEVNLVMELCHGGELFDRLRDVGRFPEALAARCIRQILEAVAHIHSKGFVHTDIKLENVLFTSKSEKASVKLIDFGFCQPCQGEKVLRLKQGTLGYMAPEVLRGRYSSKCDLFSLGVVVFSLLSGKSPFGMSRRETTEKRILDGEYSFQKGWDGVSELAKDFVNRLLATDPNQRISAADALQHPWLFSMPREQVWCNVPPQVDCSPVRMTDSRGSETSTRSGASSVLLGRTSS